jgi:hypothetical protein
VCVLKDSHPRSPFIGLEIEIDCETEIDFLLPDAQFLRLDSVDLFFPNRAGHRLRASKKRWPHKLHQTCPRHQTFILKPKHINTNNSLHFPNSKLPLSNPNPLTPKP